MNTMKYLFILAITFLLLFNLQKVNAQVKRDTIYYLLDTAKVPVKDRMFHFTAEGPAMGYTLACQCFPYGYSIFFLLSNCGQKRKEN